MSSDATDNTIQNIRERHPGAKYRPCPWYDMNREGASCVGWGIEQKAAGERFYKPVGWNGKAYPFETKGEANTLCRQLNATLEPTA